VPARKLPHVRQHVHALARDILALQHRMQQQVSFVFLSVAAIFSSAVAENALARHFLALQPQKARATALPAKNFSCATCNSAEKFSLAFAR